MERFLGKYAPYIFAIMRIMVGWMFAMHGLQKIFNIPPGNNPPPALLSQIGVAGIIELVGGVMIAAGFFGSFAAFICSGLMAFAYFMAHAPQAFLPLVNRGELAVVYCFLFLYIAAHGSGVWSIDALMGKNRVRATA